MKRREFLWTSAAGLAGSIVPALSRGQTQPCPPPSVSVSGGGSATTSCSLDAESDWLARSTGSGVVWAHDFRNEAEVKNFRWDGGIGDDPEGVEAYDILWDEGQSITGGASLCIRTQAGAQSQGVWWRPLSPLTGASNGKGVDDPGANGTIATRSFSPNTGHGGSNINSWANGFWGHSSYHSQGGFDGTEYYFQQRVRISAARYSASNPSAGKLSYFTLCARSLSAQEIVTRNDLDGEFMAYRSGSPLLEPGAQQYGSELGSLWKFPPDEWVTVLYHIVPGRDGAAETVFTVWVARQGEKAYTKIWDTRIVKLGYEDAYKYGHQAFIASSYMNGVVSPVPWSIWYDQMIFSKGLIPCPQA